MRRVGCLAAAAFLVLAQWPAAIAQDASSLPTSSMLSQPVGDTIEDTAAGDSEGVAPPSPESPAPPTDEETGAEPGSDQPAPSEQPGTSADEPATSANGPGQPAKDDFFEMSVSNASVSFGTVEPGVARVVSGPVIRVSSSKPFDLAYRTHSFAGGVSASHLSYRHDEGFVPFSRSGFLEVNHPAGTYQWQESYRLQLGFDVPAGEYRASITYTATPR